MTTADLVEQQNNLAYIVNHPISIFRAYRIDLLQFNDWNFGGVYLGSGSNLIYTSQFSNRWNLLFNLIYHAPSIDTRLLSGGYAMKIPSSINSFGELGSDHSKKFSAVLDYLWMRNGHHSLYGYSLSPGLNLRPVNTLLIGIAANYARNHNELQYVTTLVAPSGSRYILGTIDQKTLGLTFRIDYSITPDFSIQYYGSPFVSRGYYRDFKYVTHPESKDYGNRFSLYNYPVQTGDILWLDENGDNNLDYTIDDPDFNFHQFRSNFVAKWEYRPGSLIYLVWSIDEGGNITPVNTGLGDSMGQLWNRFPDSKFQIKFSYWLSL